MKSGAMVLCSFTSAAKLWRKRSGRPGQGGIKLLDFSLSSIGWRRGLGRGGAFLLVSPLLGPLPTRSSRGEDGELDAALRDSRTFTSTPSLPKCLGSSLYRYVGTGYLSEAVAISSSAASFSGPVMKSNDRRKRPRSLAGVFGSVTIFASSAGALVDRDRQMMSRPAGVFHRSPTAASQA